MLQHPGIGEDDEQCACQWGGTVQIQEAGQMEIEVD
jgi:hypothetical protein